MNTELRPKVICKNLQDIIKESMFSTKRNSIEDLQKRQLSQRVLKSEPRERRSSERCNTSVNRGNRLYESGTKLNSSLSKHSLESKEKIKILETSKMSSNVSCTRPIQPKNKIIQAKKNKHAMMPTSAVEFYPSSTKRARKQTLSSGSIQSGHMKSLYFNQVDAIFTQLEDFIRETREKICLEMDFLNEENLANKLANQLTQLSSVFRNELSGLIQRNIYHEAENDVLKPKNKMKQNKQNAKKASKTNTPIKQSREQGYFQQELIKIQQFMQRQNTINSTINSQPFQDPYIPTQTDAQLLSMLVYKNKVSSTKRKIQNTYSHGQELMGPWVKSGRSVNINIKDGQGDYSFRNGNVRESKEKDLMQGSGVVDSSMKKKKNQHLVTQKCSHKENRQKSIYQMVLQENRKSRGNWGK